MRLNSCERRTQAEVHAKAEAEMPCGVSCDVELVGIFEEAFIPIRGTDQDREVLALGDARGTSHASG